MDNAFTLSVDWLAFTVPDASVEDLEQVLGGDWSKTDTGFRGYPSCWITVNGSRGIGKLGTGAPRRPREIHVDLSGGIVATWSSEKVREVLRWVFNHGGHVTRLDTALDDRESLVSVGQVKEAVDAGQAVTRAEKFQTVSASSLRRGASTGETLYFGSGQSQTLLRVYDKRLELQHKGREDWHEYGVRWELEFKKDRAQACAKAMTYLDLENWREFLVGVLRSYIDFRQTTRDATPWEKYRAPLLSWWAQLTDGFKRCRLFVEKVLRNLQEVKRWAERSLSPMLAVLSVSTERGWLDRMIASGADRWKERHLRLVREWRQRPRFGMQGA